MVRRIAFLSGLLLGSGICAFALGSVLTFIFTGKMIAISTSREHGLRIALCDVNALREVATASREEVTA